LSKEGVLELSTEDQRVDDTLLIYLKYGGEIVDIVRAECIKDGVDGTSGHIELS
jgi:hypothetical protein